jgi:hypothetical protein
MNKAVKIRIITFTFIILGYIIFRNSNFIASTIESIPIPFLVEGKNHYYLQASIMLAGLMLSLFLAGYLLGVEIRSINSHQNK